MSFLYAPSSVVGAPNNTSGRDRRKMLKDTYLPRGSSEHLQFACDQGSIDIGGL